MPQKTLLLIRVAKSKLYSALKPITLTKVCHSVQHWQINTFNSSAISKPENKTHQRHTSELLINLCRWGKSACNHDRWDFSPSFLLNPCKSTNSFLWTNSGEDSHVRKCPPASTSRDEGLSNSETAKQWGTTQKLFHQIRHNFITVYTPAATTHFKIKKKKKKGIKQALE